VNKSKYLGIACIICLVGWGLYYFFRMEPALPKTTAKPNQETGQTLMTYDGNNIVEQRNGKKIWELTAQSIEVDNKTQNLRLKNIKGIFYQENGGKIDLTAPAGTMENKTQNVVLTGGVKATATDGSTFSADQVNWAGNRREIYGNGNITVTKGDTVITGDKIESDSNMAKIIVQGHAHVIKGGTGK
jgi:LPS export ABC transporter protein LptC